MFTINKKDLLCLETKYGDRFLISPDIHCSTSVFWRYDFSDIRREDRIIDLGANIGGFSLSASHQICKYPVLAVEPIRYQILIENIELNHAFVTPLQAGISDKYEAITLEWRDGHDTVECQPLRHLIENNGGCDFLKCDIEGAEWKIQPCEFDGIRRIEMQIHLDLCREKWQHPLIRYLLKNYNVYTTPNSPTDRISVPPHPAGRIFIASESNRWTGGRDLMPIIVRDSIAWHNYIYSKRLQSALPAVGR